MRSSLTPPAMIQPGKAANMRHHKNDPHPPPLITIALLSAGIAATHDNQARLGGG